jgi:3-phenylpropionate/trans-cinnamate dioxygenase ferredoxin subunit
MSEWISACALGDIEQEGVKRFDLNGRTYAIYRSLTDEVFCTDGLCSHEEVHLADGLVIDYEIECPKHSGAFDIRSGEALRLPACKNLKTYPARVENGKVEIAISQAS